ncbi:MAG: hypothetical protein JST00_22100 [Deltaproteobacteria bacterium]|nr:hypothetical protein [Deltaproteobacteria bacterium]
MSAKQLERLRKIVDRVGIALVYPLQGKRLPSLWSELYPGAKMDWAWDEDADPRVAEVWRLREELARSGTVAYAKWFQGRATFFSHDVFLAMLGRFETRGDPFRGLPDEAVTILDALRERSPQSTKELKASTDLRGREHERAFTRATKALWARLLLVGTGEVDDGAFPSLLYGATELVFEDLWRARTKVPARAKAALAQVLEAEPAWQREVDRSCRAIEEATAALRAPRARAKSVAARSSYEEQERGPGVSMGDEIDGAGEGDD